MERIVYDKMAELDERHWWYRARREVIAALIRRKARPPKGARLLEIGCGTGHNLAMLGEFGTVDALELDDTARAVAEKTARPAGDGLAAARASRRSGASLRFDRIIRRHRAYRRRPRRAGLDCPAVEAGRQARRHRPRAPVDVVGARRGQSPQAALFEARAQTTVRAVAAEARGDRLFQQPAVPGRGRQAAGVARVGIGGQRPQIAGGAGELLARADLRGGAGPGRAGVLTARSVAVRGRLQRR